MKSINVIISSCLFAVSAALAEGAATNTEKCCQPSWKTRGHENTEWSVSYSYHLIDAKRHLPRVLLVGDSICNGYFPKTAQLLRDKVNITYWTSSYCVTSKNYLKLLSIVLDEAKYDVIHFNNGLHSLSTKIKEYGKAYRAALQLIKKMQPDAKVIYVSSTPMTLDWKTKLVSERNATASAIAGEFAGISSNDLFALMAPLDRKVWWYDECHFTPAGYDKLAAAVAEKVVETCNGRQTGR